MLEHEWRTFRSPGRLLGTAAVVLVTVLLGVLVASAHQSSCSAGPVEVPCPADPVGPDGAPVRDQFTFAHRPLGESGSVTVRLAELTGIITYPPPDHDEIVPGLVPWSKAGIIVKDGVTQGSAYAAIMLTGTHGVRMQYDYTHDIAGSPAPADTPRWLRLTRDGDTVTGHESPDGVRWTEVGTAHLPGLPATAQVGLFAASPGDLTLRPFGLGATVPESRFTQTSAVFDDVEVTGAPAGLWTAASVGESGATDWDKFHRAPGLVEEGGTLTVTGSGDIAPGGSDAGHPVERSLFALPLTLIVLVVLAVRYATGSPARTRRILLARAGLVGVVGLVAGVVAAGVVLPLGAAILDANGIAVPAPPAPTVIRVVLGVGALLGVTAVLAYAIGALVRRPWPATLLAVAAIALPAVFGVVPLLPDDVSELLLTVTPAAGLAVQQTVTEYPQVLGHYVPATGFYPLPGWAGLGVLCAYAAVTLVIAARVGAPSRTKVWDQQGPS
jgi:hypothetical protein